MQAYVLKRLLWMLPIVFGAATFIFLLMNVVPGDVAQVILGMEGQSADPELLAALREQLGLNRPLYVQYLSWLWDLARLDLGVSLWTGEPVAKEISTRLPYTVTLVVLSVIISVVFAVPIGIFAALRQDTWLDYALRSFAIAGLSIPSFWFAVLIVLFLTLSFGWFPPVTYATIYQSPSIAFQQLIFPAIALGYRQTAVTARMMRSSALEVLREDYLRTARAKGLREQTVVFVHALKNALIPVITLFGVEAVAIFSGAVVVERVFNVPGVASLLVDALLHRDIPLGQGVIIVIVGFVALTNLAVDLVYAWVDPRVRYD